MAKVYHDYDILNSLLSSGAVLLKISANILEFIMYLLFACVAGMLALLAGACSYAPRPSRDPRVLSKNPNAKTSPSFSYQVLCAVSSVAASWAGLIFVLRWLYPSAKVIFIHRIGMTFQETPAKMIEFPTVVLGCLFVPLSIGWALGRIATRPPATMNPVESEHSPVPTS